VVRKYVRKGRPQWRDKDKRMARAVALRAQGLSLRQIAEKLAVSAPTAMRDLRRHDELAAEQAQAVQNVFQLPVTSRPAGGDLKQANETDAATPISLAERRKA
jgi:IS30 family transposase